MGDERLRLDRLRPALAVAALMLGGLVLGGLVLGGCSSGVLTPRGPVGEAERTILIDSTAIMLAIVVPVILATLGVAWWFRASNARAKHLPNWSYSGRVELVVWAIPLLTIMFLGGVAWIGAHQLDPARPLSRTGKPLEIQVVSLDWKWLFIYPDQRIASVNQAVVPAGLPVHFSLTSASVMNAFFVPQLGSMIYTMNGMSTNLNLQADRPGLFYGESVMFSGDGFSDMHFDLRAVTAQQFAAWIATARGAGPVLDDRGYRGLARQSQKVAPFTYRDVQPDLFRTIVTQAVPQGPGPQLKAPSRAAPARAEG